MDGLYLHLAGKRRRLYRKRLREAMTGRGQLRKSEVSISERPSELQTRERIATGKATCAWQGQ